MEQSFNEILKLNFRRKVISLIGNIFYHGLQWVHELNEKIWFMIKISNDEKQIFIEWMGRFYLGKKQETKQQLASLEKDITDNILVKKNMKYIWNNIM